MEKHNCVIAYTYVNKNRAVITQGTFLHNTKVLGSKINEDKMFNNQRKHNFPHS